MAEKTTPLVTLVSKDGKTKITLPASDKGEINRWKALGATVRSEPLRSAETGDVKGAK
jgi:hypothetical protein